MAIGVPSSTARRAVRSSMSNRCGAALISRAGVSTKGFGGFVDSERCALIDRTDVLLEQGLLSAPAFVLEEEIFHGREHLPLIRWMLEGSGGTPPV